jgi:hypothetical protein
MKHLGKSAVAISACACAAIFSFSWSEQGGLSLSAPAAEARVGRPLTPVSAAGVARRHARRGAYGYGAAAGVAAVGAAATAVAASHYGDPGYYGETDHYYGEPGYHEDVGYYHAAPGYGDPYHPYHFGAEYHPDGAYAAYHGYHPAQDYGYHPVQDYNYHPVVQDYATRNGFVCHPGTLVKMDDGLMYHCQ